MDQQALYQKIDHWKDSLREAGAFSEEQLYELEDHLQERLNDLLASGYSEAAAFEAASESLGQPLDLSAAYSINNRPLMLKQLLLYFLLGFPLIGFIYQAFYLTWNLIGISLIENGIRGFNYGVAILLPGSLLLAFLGWKTFKNPYWLVQVPRKMVQQSRFGLFATLVLIGLLLLGQHSIYSEWFFDNNFLKPRDYLQHDFSEPLSVFYFFSGVAMIVINLMLFFSIALDAIQNSSISKNTWNKICLATLLIGFHFFGALTNFADYFILQFGIHDNLQQVEVTKEMIKICSILTLSIPGLFILRKMDKKGKVLSEG